MKKGYHTKQSKSKKKSQSKAQSKQKQKSQDLSVIQIQNSPYSQKMLNKIPSKHQKSKKALIYEEDNNRKKTSVSSSKSKSKQRTISKDKFSSNKIHKKTIQKIYLNTPPIQQKKISNEQSLQKLINKYQNRELSTSKKGFQKIVSNDSKSFIGNFYLGKIAEDQNNKQSAKQFYRVCAKLNYKAKYADKYAYCCLYLAKYEQAIDACKKYLKSNKEQSQNIYASLGKAYYYLSKYGPALDAFSCAISQNNKNYQYYLYQGDCYRMMQAYQVALNSYKTGQALLMRPNKELLTKQIECYIKLGDKKNALKAKHKLSFCEEEIQKCIMINISKPELPAINKNPYNPSQNLERKMNSAESIVDSQSMFPGIYSDRSSTKNNSSIIEQIEAEINIGNTVKGLNMINKLIKQQPVPNIDHLQTKAKILFQIGDYEDCEQTITQILRASESHMVPLIQILVPSQESQRNFSNLRNIMRKLKQLNAYSLTAEEDSRMMDRRKKCLEQALNVFKKKKINDSLGNTQQLNIILQQSSIRSSRYYDIEPNSIFLLRYTRQTLQNWSQNKFSLNSLRKTSDIAFNMVKLQPKQFSIVPTHVLYYTIKHENISKTFEQVNKEVQTILQQISIKYPPSQKSISESILASFKIEWKDQPRLNLFSENAVFRSYRQIHKAIQILAQKASHEYEKMSDICHRYCIMKNKGFSFKIGLKLEKNLDGMYEERVLSRIVEKLFKKQIEEKKNKMMRSMKLNGKGIEQYFKLIFENWEQLINEIIEEKRQKNEKIKCYVYDLLRAKCLFYSANDIKAATQSFINAHHQKQIYLIEVDNRLDYKTRDVVLKFKIDEIVGELQLALEFQSVQNQFSHGLYELVRSPFGGFFASLMWFSGFALKKHKLFLNQRIKWQLRGLQHLRKFIYDEQLIITIISTFSNTAKQFKLTQFFVSNQYLVGFLSYKGSYVCIKNRNVSLDDKQPSRISIKIIEGNLLYNQQQNIKVIIREDNTLNFLTLANQDLKLMFLEDSLDAQPLKINIKSTQSQTQHKQIISQTKRLQKTVYEMIQNPICH